MNLDHGVDIYLYRSTGEIVFIRQRDTTFFVLEGEYEPKDIGHITMSALDSKLFKDYEWKVIDKNFCINWGGVLCASARRESDSVVVTSPLYEKNIEDHPQVWLPKNPKYTELGEAILGRFEYGKVMEEKNA